MRNHDMVADQGCLLNIADDITGFNGLTDVFYRDIRPGLAAVKRCDGNTAGDIIARNFHHALQWTLDSVKHTADQTRRQFNRKRRAL